ncbi:hypothetical protein SALBM311S_00238 [Streptomyces alboniger]
MRSAATDRTVVVRGGHFQFYRCPVERFASDRGVLPEVGSRVPTGGGAPLCGAGRPQRRTGPQRDCAAGFTMPRTVRDFTKSPIAVMSHSPEN